MDCKLCIEYYRSSCKFEIPVRSCSSQQTSFANSCYKINLRESPIASFIYISRATFIKIINADKNNKRVYEKNVGKRRKRLLHLWLTMCAGGLPSWAELATNNILCTTLHSFQQEALLPQRDRATRCVSRNLVNCCTTVGTWCTTIQLIDNKSK